MKKNKNVKPKNVKKTILRMFSYFKYNKLLLFTGLFSILIATVASVGSNALLSPIIDHLVQGEFHSFIRYLLLMALLMGLVAVFQYIGILTMARLSQKTVYRIRKDMFHHLQKLPVAYYDASVHGDLMSTFTNDIDMLNQSLEQSVVQILVAIVSLIGAFVMMIILSIPLTLVVLVMMGVMFLSIAYIGKRSAKYFRARQKDLADMNGYVEEMITGQKVVKVFNFEKRSVEAFEKKNEALRESSAAAATYGVVLMPVMGNLSYIMYALVAMFGGFFVIAGRLSVGNIAAFLQYTRTVSRPIAQVSSQFNMLFAALAGAERIFAILDEPEEEATGDVTLAKDGCTETGYCWLVPSEDGNVQRVPVRGDIVFENVDFGYVSHRRILHGISLFAKPGQKIALVGSTGAGKTTIMNLINRFYEISGGRILYDGIDVKRIDPFALRTTLNAVLQDVHLFETTIKENIRYGRLDATDEEVIEAAKMANAHHFIVQLPQGYDTVLTMDGGNLSQGQRQLLSIARAAIKDPVVLILDEATSSIDTRTEEMIEKAMDTLMANRTAFVIAHRLSTVRRSDAIMVMENGKIIERGDHENLMEQKGRYYRLNMGLAELS